MDAALSLLKKQQEHINQTVCLVSSASLDKYPSNTRTNFSNQLPESIKTEHGKVLYVRVQNVGISTHAFSTGTGFAPDYIKIHVYEIRPQMEGVGYSRFVAGFRYPPSYKCGVNFGLHTFQHSPYLPLSINEIQKLQVRLTDYRNADIECDQGPHTFVTLVISDKMEKEEFTVHCLSRQPDLFVENRLANFTSPIPKEMTLEKYEVAMLNVVYPPLTKQIQKARLTINGVNFTYELEDFDSTIAFIRRVRDDIQDSQFRRYLFFNRVARGLHRGSAYIRRSAHESVDTVVRISTSHSFTIACGQTNRALAPTYLQAGETILFDGKPDINNVLDKPVAMLHCSIIEPTVMGGKHAHVLQAVPLKSVRQNDQDLIYEPPQLAFHPVIPRPFTSISFKFTDIQGEESQFISPFPEEDAILVTLVFRRKK